MTRFKAYERQFRTNFSRLSVSPTPFCAEQGDSVQQSGGEGPEWERAGICRQDA
jgi:hypothetical protein